MSSPPTGFRVALWRRRFWPRPAGQPSPPVAPADPLRAAGQLLRDSREAKGLRLRDLAERTRISIAVLEALEGGWKDRLPEATYLRTMLPMLEQALDLPPASLEPALPVAGPGTKGTATPQGLTAAIFSPFTIHFLTRWQGTVLYGLLTLGVLLALNHQQQRLAAQGLLASRPIPLAPVAREGRGQPSPAGDPPLRTPLQPLSRAAGGVAMELLARESERAGGEGSLGVLQLTLATPTRVDLRSPRGGDWRVEPLQGVISLPVLPPFQLRLSPPPPPGAVRWKGKPLPATTAPIASTRDTRFYAVPTPTP